SFIDQEALLATFRAWTIDKGRSLGDLLVERGALSGQRHALLSALVDEHVRAHGGDPQQSLATLSTIGSARAGLAMLDDVDLQARLARVGVARAPSGDVDRDLDTRASMVGTPSSSGVRFRILRPHAKGGLGQVFVARDEELNREVALKEIQDRHADDL